MKHTPGPWTAYNDSCAKCEEDGTQEWGVTGPPGGYHAPFTNEADARLIAAAPELLEALQSVVRIFSGYQGLEMTSARAAIAKALDQE